jgi:hypothetical protein
MRFSSINQSPKKRRSNMADTNTTPRNPPEKEFPAGRTGKAVVWLHPNGRSITISPPRYKDQQTGNWRDGSFFPGDLPALIYALQRALDYCYSAPVPNQDNDDPPVN